MSSWVVPAVTTLANGLVLWQLKRYFDRRDVNSASKEKDRTEYEFLTLKAISASIALGEATADAFKIGKCNGKMEKAQQYATDIKHEINDFMFRKGVERIS